MKTIIQPDIMYLFKVNNKSTRKRCEICSRLTINDVVDLVLVFLLLTLNIFHNFFSAFIIDVENNSMYGGIDLSIFFIIFIICDKHDICDRMYICSCYRTVPSAIWEIFSEFLIFCNFFHKPLGE